ncbi:mannitol dehydrogenase family protein [Oenococcus oeni]|uniref:mannitol dehydrogenase family protein n=1 Tax=Oenococcus oeni TaxID=1247 RepID=UPI003EE791B8
MVSLKDDYLANKDSFEKAGITVPTFNQTDVISQGIKNPVWVHFGGGNLFRGFHSGIAQSLIEQGELPTGVSVIETYDDAVISEIYRAHNNRHLSVVMHADGTFDKTLNASVAASYYFNASDSESFEEVAKIFENSSLQVASFSITEKGYNLTDSAGSYIPIVQSDIDNDPHHNLPKNNMTALTFVLLRRFKKTAAPIALLSTDNFSKNGDKLRNSVLTIANEWLLKGFVPQDFVDYLSDQKQVSFPYSMIDRITPNPSEEIGTRLKKDGFDDVEIVHTPKHTNIAPFANTEEVHYLVVEDNFPNGRPAFEKAGVLMTDRETVNDADQMKVTAALNPLHTALAIFGSILGYKSISSEMKNDDLVNLIKNIGYSEGLPVVKSPGIIDPKKFIDQLLQKRLPNPYIPDTPQRIATDTSQKIPVRYGETIKRYASNPSRSTNSLEFIPLTIAAWLRYLLAIDDQGQKFEPSPDPFLEPLQRKLSGIGLGSTNIHDQVAPILSDSRYFGSNLYEVGLGDKVEKYFVKLLSGENAVSKTLHETLEDKSHFK